MEGLKLSQTDRIWLRSMQVCRKYFRCHQIADRSFFIGEYQFPICARCTGIAIGHVCGVLVSVFRDLPFTILFGTIPLIVDGGMQQITDYESTNLRRLITGILYGFSTMASIFHFIRLILRKRQS